MEGSDADAQAMAYARSWTRRGSGMGQPAPSPQPPAVVVQQAGPSVARTLIVVAGIVAVAWMWFRSRKKE